MYATSIIKSSKPNKIEKNYAFSTKYIVLFHAIIFSVLFSTQACAGQKFSTIIARETAVPATYHSFDATLTNNKVNLSWITDVETGNDHFEIERSFDKTEFSTIGIILGALSGDATTSQYSFRDGAAELLNHSIIYYRLKKIDADEKITYSAVKAVQINTTVVTKTFAQILPNPYMDKLNVSFVTDASGKAEVRLINASGNLVKTTTSSISKGYNNIQLQDLQSQAPGLYIADVTINGKVVISLKVLKQ